MATSATSTYVQNLYKNILQRTGDTGGIDYWVAKADAGASASSIVNSFIGSPEAQNVTAILHLYDVFFNRAADNAGLTGWVNVLKSGASLLDIAKAFAASSEFQVKLAGVSTADYVEATYGNLFGRASDASGKAHWIAKIDSGELTRAEVSLAFTLSPEALASTGAATHFTESYLVLRAAGTAEPTTAAVDALALKSLSAALAEKITGYETGTGFTVTGKLVDGYLSGATVFADANGDGKWNEGEATATTDAKGNFSLDGAKGALVASGGTDLSTGKAFKGVLKATEGSTMINPLTSLQQGFVEKGMSAADAELKVAKALGLDASKFDLTTFDPLASSLDANASAEDRALGAQLQAQAAKVANFMVAAAATLTGAAGGADKLDAATAGASLLDAMVNAISSDSDGVVSFSDKAMLQSVMNDAAANSGDADLLAASSKVAAMADEFAAMSAASADNIDQAVAAGGDITAMMANIAQAQVVAQGDMADKMLAAAESGDLAAMESSFTGAAFDKAADKAAIGDLDPNSDTDDKAAADSNTAADEAVAADPDTETDPGTGGGGGGGGTPAATFTVTESGDLDEILTLSAANGDVVFTVSGGDYVFTPETGTAVTMTSRVIGKIIVPAGITLVGTAADLSSTTIVGLGSVAVNALESTLRADLSHITAMKVTADVMTVAGTPVTLDKGFDFGTAAVAIHGNGDFVVNSAQIGIHVVFNVDAGAQLIGTSTNLSGKTIIGTGHVSIELAATTDTSHFDAALHIIGVVHDADLDLSTGFGGNIANLDELFVDAGKTVTLTAEEADARDGLVISGSGIVIIIGSDGAQVINVTGTGTNTINAGAGADQITLGAGADTVVIGGADVVAMQLAVTIATTADTEAKAALATATTAAASDAAVLTTAAASATAEAKAAVDADTALATATTTASSAATALTDANTALTNATTADTEAKAALALDSLNETLIATAATAASTLATAASTATAALTADTAAQSALATATTAAATDASALTTAATAATKLATDATTADTALATATATAGTAAAALVAAHAALANAASESAPGYGVVDATIDVIHGFTLGTDHLQLAGGAEVLADVTNAVVNGKTITVVNGVVTTTTETDGDALVSELLTLLDTTTNSVAFNWGADAYVLQGNGVTGGQVGDILLKLAGTHLTDLATVFPDTAAPTLRSAVPADGAGAVAVGANIVLTFSEAVAAGTGNIVITNGTDDTDTRTIAVGDTTQVSISGATVTINPTLALTAESAYHVKMALGVITDTAPAHNAYAGISDATTLNFTTAVAADTTAPDAPTGVTLLSHGGTVTANTVNITNTSLDFSATIVAGQATGGIAEFYVGSTPVGADHSIAATDTSVTWTTADADPTNADLQLAIAAGGLVTVKLSDASLNHSTSSVGNPTLAVDYAVPNAIPTITGLPATAQNVTAGVVSALADFTVADTNAGDTLTVTLTATNGTIGGLTDADGNAANGIQLTGTATAINTGLALATFTATTAGNATSIDISLTDGNVSTPVTAIYGFTTAAVGLGTLASPSMTEGLGSDVINGNQSNLAAAEPKPFNAANGNDEYVISADTALYAANISISGFGQGDHLAFAGKTLAELDSLYSVGDDTFDVSLYANDGTNNGQQIILVGMTGTTGSVGTIDTVTKLAAYLGDAFVII